MGAAIAKLPLQRKRFWSEILGALLGEVLARNYSAEERLQENVDGGGYREIAIAEETFLERDFGGASGGSS